MKWDERMPLSSFTLSTSEDHVGLAAWTAGYNISILWPSLLPSQYYAFAQKEPPHSLIVLCQVGVLPVIVSQHSTA